MIVGTVITKLAGDAYYSPEFPGGSLSATFICQVLSLYGSPTVTITVQHRNSDDLAFTDAGAFSDITSAGIVTKDLTALKERLRFKYEFDVGDDASDAMYFLMQAPTWWPV